MLSWLTRLHEKGRIRNSHHIPVSGFGRNDGMTTEPTGPTSLADIIKNLPIRPASSQTGEASIPVSYERLWPSGVSPSRWDMVPEASRVAIEKAISESRWPIFLTGPVGTGKSCAAACVYRNWKRWALWHRTGEIVGDVLKCRSNDKGFVVRHRGETSYEEWELGIMSKIAEASLLVFDDVGLRSPTPAAYEVFYTMVESRIDKPTIYTTNLNSDELTKVFDERITSRLLRGARIRMSGDDRRISQGETYCR